MCGHIYEGNHKIKALMSQLRSTAPHALHTVPPLLSKDRNVFLLSDLGVSRMAYDGRIMFLDIPFSGVQWTRNDSLAPVAAGGRRLGAQASGMRGVSEELMAKAVLIWNTPSLGKTTTARG